MNKYLYLKITVLSILLVSGQNLKAKENVSEPDSALEVIPFHIKYGWFTIGKGHLEIEPVFFRGSWHTRILVEGKTSGLLSSFKPYASVYESYIDPASLLPDSAYSFENASDRINYQISEFMVNQDQLEIYSLVNDSTEKVRKFPLTNTPIYDALGTFLFLRKMPLRKLQKGDSVMLDVFYEKKLYPFGVEYIGKDVIELQKTKRDAFELFLLFPLSSTFPEPYLARMWISDDDTQTPLMVKLKLKIGYVVLEMIPPPRKKK